MQVLEHQPVSLRSIRPAIDRDLETICLKCLEKEPSKRYDSALALAEDLERWLTGQPIQARPSGVAERMLKWAKRNPYQTFLVVALVCWYFNVRLQSAWFEWTPYAAILLLTLLSLARLLGRAGKSIDAPLDVVQGVYLVGVALVGLFVLGFYPGDFADRISLSDNILFASLSWGILLRSLWLRMRAGPLSAALRPNRPAMILFGLLIGMMLVAETEQLIHVSDQTGDQLVRVCSVISSMSINILLLLTVVVGTEIRKRGCVTFFRFVRWEDIDSYEWTATYTNWNLKWKNSLTLRLKRRSSPLPLELIVRADRKETVEGILRALLPQCGPVVPTSATG